jgi:uncharacterized protein with PIN domain
MPGRDTRKALRPSGCGSIKVGPISLRFAADSMLGSLARKLRLYGFDVFYESTIEDDELLRVCSEQGRALVTSDRQLYSACLKKGLVGVLVTTRGDVDATVQVFDALGLHPELSPGRSRCPLCNGEIREITSEEARRSVRPGVLGHHKTFYRCVSCQQVYWEGSHWFRLKQFNRRVEEGLKK